MDTREMARMLGRRGGLTRARRLAAADRSRIASLGGEARRRSLQMARRIADNFQYAAAVAKLRGRSREVVRMKTFTGPLPGIYPDRS